MITKIEIKNTATYGSDPQIIQNLKKINCFYGPNGSGKTTISRVINKPDNYSDCNITWENNKLETFVYNSDFIEDNFATSKLKGIFTLGSGAVNAQAELKIKKEELKTLSNELTGYIENLEGNEAKNKIGKSKELDSMENEYTGKLWNKMQPYKNIFAKSLSGCLNNKEKFKEILLYNAINNYAELKPKEDLIEKEETLYKTDLFIETEIKMDNSIILPYESNPLLSKAIIGKTDIDIAKLITVLNNSDWVHKGTEFLDKSDGLCPFCQHEISTDFRKNLDNYFDEEFTNNIKELKQLKTNYENDASTVKNSFTTIENKNERFVNKDKLNDKITLFNTIYDKNIALLENKIKEPARNVQLETLSIVLADIDSIIKDTNEKIKSNNDLFNNYDTEKNNLKNEVWKFILNETKDVMDNHNTNKVPIIKAIEGLKVNIEKKQTDKTALINAIKELEKQTTSTQSTCNEINKILNSFGFKSFSLKPTEDNYYQIIRSDGCEVRNTLSEGEKRFLTFLYFYNLTKGNISETDISTDRIVVIDDPISSLDSEILFMVTTLIRSLAIDIIKGSYIKQLFILTHNIYFYKEVSFDNKKIPLSSLFFGTVNKNNDLSIIKEHETNPIKTSYEMLWAQIKCADYRNNATIQNVMRRILENHFKLFGHTPINDLEDKFTDARDKAICRSLCSWVHDGSHSISDDLYYTSLDNGQISKFLKIFQDIFEKTGHISHYNIMMDIKDDAPITDAKINERGE